MVPISIIAVLLCTLVAIVLGTLWYGPLFGKVWMKESGISLEAVAQAKHDPVKKKAMMKSYFFMALGAFLMAYVMAHSLVFASTYLNISGVNAGLQGAFWNWLGFVAPVSVAGVLWEGKSWKWWLITAGYYLVSLSFMGVILSSWPG